MYFLFLYPSLHFFLFSRFIVSITSLMTTGNYSHTCQVLKYQSSCHRCTDDPQSTRWEESGIAAQTGSKVQTQLVWCPYTDPAQRGQRETSRLNDAIKQSVSVQTGLADVWSSSKQSGICLSANFWTLKSKRALKQTGWSLCTGQRAAFIPTARILTRRQRTRCRRLKMRVEWHQNRNAVNSIQ